MLAPRRCYTEAEKNKLKAILTKMVDALDQDHIRDVGDLGLASSRLVLECHELDGYEDEADSEERFIDGLSGDWANSSLNEFMAPQPDRQSKACCARSKPTLQQLRSQSKRRKVAPYYQ